MFNQQRGVARSFLGAATLAFALVLAAAASPRAQTASPPAPGGAGAQPGTAAALQDFDGVLTIQWSDPRRGAASSGETRFSLTPANGRPLRLQLSAALAHLAFRHFGKQVSLKGRLGADASGASTILVNSIAAASAAPTAAAPVTGTRRALYLLLKFSDDIAVPHPPNFYSDLTNPDTPPPGSSIPATLNGFFKKTSWNQLSWVGDVGGIGGVPASGWITLPHPKSYYAPCGWSGSCANLDAIQNDGMAAGAAQGINFSVYDNINFVLSNDLDCCSWGGNFTYNGVTYGGTWEAPWGQETGTYAHEYGHSIGLPHSGWVYYDYDSPWDVMSDRTVASQINCGSYFSDNDRNTDPISCTEPGDGYIAAHKDVLGWIPSANQIVASPTTTVNATIEADALPLGQTAKMVKVCLPNQSCTTGDSNAHYLTVEARIGGQGATSQYDNGLTGQGVIIHDVLFNRAPIGTGNPCFFNDQSGWAVPIDATPGDWIGSPQCNSPGPAWPNYGLGNAEWLPGKACKDATDNLQIAVTQQLGSSYVVTISPLNQPSYPLSISEIGNGTVTSAPSGINCPGTCSASFTGGTQVQLTAAPAAGWSFTGWGGACGGAGNCAVSVSAAQSVSATFTQNSYTLAVGETGSGTVTSSPEGISCGGSCSANFASGTQVQLTATPSPGWSFTGWGGACGGAGSCVVTMNAAQSVSANFTQQPLPLSVGVSGGGMVTSSPAGISCGATCDASFAGGTEVALTATPAAGWSFIGWGGACSGSTGCTVSMSTAQSVTATFMPGAVSLSVSAIGGGVVTSDPPGIACGDGQGHCVAAFPAGSAVTLTAAPNRHHALKAWMGACGGSGACAVTMTANEVVIARFKLALQNRSAAGATP